MITNFSIAYSTIRALRYLFEFKIRYFFPKKTKLHSSVLYSIIRSFTKISGEINVLETVVTPSTDISQKVIHFREMTIFFEILFIILMPILLNNLMV